MKTYAGYYRTLLTDEEKKQFNRIASFKGSVTQIHDDLIRKYVQDNKTLPEASKEKKRKSHSLKGKKYDTDSRNNLHNPLRNAP